MTRRSILLAVLVFALSGACHKSWSSSATQPPLRLGATQEARTSLPQVIALRDMELPRWIVLTNTAYFVVVSRDRLRFHVALTHKWESMSDPRRWRVWIEDERGARTYPEGVDRRVLEPLTEMYELGTRNAVTELPLQAVTVWRGYGDYVFYDRDLFDPGMRTLTLVMKRPGYEYRYRWRFTPERSPYQVAGLRH